MSKFIECGGLMWCPVHHGVAMEGTDTHDECDNADDDGACDLRDVFYQEPSPPPELPTGIHAHQRTRSTAGASSPSRTAATLLTADTCRENHLTILDRLTLDYGGLTDEQIAAAVNHRRHMLELKPVSPSTLRARRSELCNALPPLVIDTGRRRAKSDTGRPSTVWAITSHGRDALRNAT